MKLQRSFALLASHIFLGLGILGILSAVALFTAQRYHASADSPSFVRVIHASPDIGTADVFVDGAQLLSSFQFGAVTDYVAVPPGAHQVVIALVGKGINAPVLTQTLTVAPGVAYTVAATGSQSTNLALDVFIDNNQLVAGTSRLRVYQLSPDAGALNVATPEKTLLTGIAYQAASDYLTIPSGDYQFDVTAPALTTKQSIAATLKANMITSLFAVGMVNGTPPFELVSAQAQGVPGLPNTGSDPNPPSLPAAGGSPNLWLIGLLGTTSLLCLASCGFTRHLARKRT